MKSGLTNIENRILKDLSACAVIVVLVICMAYSLEFPEALARRIGGSVHRDLVKTLIVASSGICLLGILLLRRLKELRRVTRERIKIAKRLYEAKRNEALARLSMGIAHDFNNFLMAINGLSSLALGNRGIDNETHCALTEINATGERAALLVRQFLDFGKKKTSESKKDLLDINRIVSDLKPLLAHLAGNTVLLTTNLQPDLAQIKSNITQIEEIIVNLILNAHDAMPNGGELAIQTSNIKIDMPSECKELRLKPGKYVMLSVKDTGSGIDPETKRRIFQPFFSTKEKGLGLGLSMVSGIVRDNGGGIRVDSDLGKGATFEIYLPCAEI